jgi:hypothetical protein
MNEENKLYNTLSGVFFGFNFGDLAVSFFLPERREDVFLVLRRGLFLLR